MWNNEERCCYLWYIIEGFKFENLIKKRLYFENKVIFDNEKIY